MASGRLVEDGTEGPFHPHRAFASRPVRPDIESPHRQKDEFGSESVGFAPSVVRTMSWACDGPTFATGIASLTVSAGGGLGGSFAACGPRGTATLRGGCPPSGR